MHAILGNEKKNTIGGHLINGKVEIMVEGEKENVIQFIDWCHVGPWSAIVENVDIIWENYRGEFFSFNIRG